MPKRKPEGAGGSDIRSFFSAPPAPAPPAAPPPLPPAPPAAPGPAAGAPRRCRQVGLFEKRPPPRSREFELPLPDASNSLAPQQRLLRLEFERFCASRVGAGGVVGASGDDGGANSSADGRHLASILQREAAKFNEGDDELLCAALDATCAIPRTDGVQRMVVAGTDTTRSQIT